MKIYPKAIQIQSFKGLERFVEVMSKDEEIVERLKKKYGVSSLKEFEKKILSGKIDQDYPGDFGIENDWLLWSDIEYKAKKRGT